MAAAVAESEEIAVEPVGERAAETEVEVLERAVLVGDDSSLVEVDEAAVVAVDCPEDGGDEAVVVVL